ncbi:MAG TPA: HAMP domain-containing sensor histidine kinase [Acidimicrobiia bacterium]
MRRIHPGWWVALIGGALLAGWAVVSWSGGTRTAMPHLMYLPIVVAALVGGVRAGLLTAAIAGLLMGPLMPLDTALKEPQTLGGWALRMAFFVVVGLIVGEGRRRLLKMEQTRQKFISAVAHEVRTPLSAILGFSQIISDRFDDLPEKEMREFVHVINKEVGELQDIIEGYIVAARLDDEALVFEPRPIELDTAVREALERLPETVVDGKLRLDLQPAVCWADPVRARQAIRALVGHCLAYLEGDLVISTWQNGKAAVVAARHRSDVTRDVLMEGMAPMTQVRPGATRPHPVGMGLAVASRLADLMGGSLFHHSNGSHSSFEMHLPVPSAG